MNTLLTIINDKYGNFIRPKCTQYIRNLNALINLL